MSALSASPHASIENAASRRVARRGLSRSGKIRAVLALGAVVGLGTVATLAAWSDTGSATASFSTGTLDLKLNGQDTAQALTSLTMTAAKPGDALFSKLAVTNAGTVAFNYTFTTALTPASGAGTAAQTALDANLLISAVVIASPSATCDATAFTAPTATVLPSTTLVAAAASTGTTARPLAATTGAEELCFQAQLPSSTPNTAQGAAATTATFTFTATQQ